MKQCVVVNKDRVLGFNNFYYRQQQQQQQQTASDETITRNKCSHTNTLNIHTKHNNEDREIQDIQVFVYTYTKYENREYETQVFVHTYTNYEALDK